MVKNPADDEYDRLLLGASGAGGDPRKTTDRGEVAGAGETEPAKRTRRTQQQKVRNQGGVRTVRWYSVNGPELKSLATLQGVGGIMVALGTFLAGVWLSTKQGLEMSGKDDITAEMRASWETAQSLAGWAAIGAFAIAAILLAVNGWSIWTIYREHEHGK